jgi:hypothetical protein
LKELPSSIGELNAFEKPYLSWCLDSEEHLSDIGQSIGQSIAHAMFYVLLSSSLKELPSFIGQLKALDTLVSYTQNLD